MSIEKEFHFEDPFMNPPVSPPVLRPSPRLHSGPMLLPNIAAPLPRAKFHALIVPQGCRVTPSGDISCLNCSPRVSGDALGRRFMLLSFPKHNVWHPCVTFYTFIVPKGYSLTLSGNVSCQNCSQRVSCDTLG